MLVWVLLAAQASQPLAGQLPPAPERRAGAFVVEPAGMFIAACDADGDARVTQAELDRCVARSFAGVGSSGRGIGYIDYGDWAKRWLGDSNALPSPFEIDRNGDGQITLDELTARFDAIFARLDRNHDGAITRDELVITRPTGPGGGGEGARPGGWGGGQGRGRGRRGGGGGGASGWPGG